MGKYAAVRWGVRPNWPSQRFIISTFTQAHSGLMSHSGASCLIMEID